MISTSREKGFQAKQEGDTNESSNLISNPPTSSSSRQWSRFRNPRIVRVSQSFGGKDRHSKVCTVRGLRDRRIRLSVPTAIQLYDLQDRLGLSQPSKVIDWLIDVTKNDIDKLPPLQIPQGLFGHHQQQQQQQMMQLSNNATTTSSLSPFFDGIGGIKINSTTNVDGDHVSHQNHQDQSKYWDLEASSSLMMMRAKGKEVERDLEDKNTMPLLNPYSYNHWEPSNLLSLSQFGSGHEFVPQQEQSADQNSLLYTNDFPSGSHHQQLFFCQPAALPSLFPTFASSEQEGGHDHSSSRQLINHFQLMSQQQQQPQQHNSLLPINSLATSSSLVKPFSLNVNLGHGERNPDEGDA